MIHFQHENDMPQTENCINWADGFILVYSITDRSSFNYIKLVKQYITDMRQGSSTLPPQSAACAGSGGGNSGASSPNSTSGSTTSAATATAAAAAAVTAASATSLSTNVPFVLLGNKGSTWTDHEKTVPERVDLRISTLADNTNSGAPRP